MINTHEHNMSSRLNQMAASVLVFVLVVLLSGVQCQNDSVVYSNFVRAFQETRHVKHYNLVQDINQLFLKIGISTAVTNQQISQQCRDDSLKVLDDAAGLQIWALQMLDSTAKQPSGILNGNTNQYGDYDQCLQVSSQRIQAKYCLANIEIRLDRDRYETLDDLIHSYRNIRSDINDPGHRVPKLSSNNWGICVPASCDSRDLELSLNDVLNNGTSLDDGIMFDVSVDPELCYVEGQKQLGAMNYLAILFFITLAISIFLGTYSVNEIQDTQESKLISLLRCFSLKRNIKSLFTVKEDDIPSIHGARFLFALALLISHKKMAMLFNPTTNRTMMMEELIKPWSTIGRTVIVYTDGFIGISGFLTALSLFKTLDKDKKFDLKEKYFSRILRFAPNLFVLIIFCTYVMDFLSSGPQWGLVVGRYSNFCKKNMWRNFLFIHNLFGFEEMCLTHTHQVGLDMQLYLISPLIVYLIWKMPKTGLLISTLIAAWSTWLRYSVTMEHDLSTMVHYGITVGRLFKTARLQYIIPTHRVTIYLIGLITGYFWHRGIKTLTLKPYLVRIGWTAAVTSLMLALCGPYHMGVRGYVYNQVDAAMFTAFSPIAFGIFLVLTLVLCETGNGGWFFKFLSYKYFSIFSKISYAVYLVQFPVFFFNVGRERTTYYSTGSHDFLNPTEFGIIVILSILLTVVVDMPCQEIKKVFTKSSRKVKVKVEDEQEQKENLVTIPNGLRKLHHG